MSHRWSLLVGIAAFGGLLACSGSLTRSEDVESGAGASSRAQDDVPIPMSDAGRAQPIDRVADAGGIECTAQGYTWDGRSLETPQPCTYSVPGSTPWGKPIDLFSMKVVATTIENGADASWSDSKDGFDKGSAEGCGDDYGWYYSAALVHDAPTRYVVLCPKSCSVAVEPTTWVRISVEWPCEQP